MTLFFEEVEKCLRILFHIIGIRSPRGIRLSKELTGFIGPKLGNVIGERFKTLLREPVLLNDIDETQRGLREVRPAWFARPSMTLDLVKTRWRSFTSNSFFKTASLLVCSTGARATSSLTPAASNAFSLDCRFVHRARKISLISSSRYAESHLQFRFFPLE